ncbi:MAG: protease inhibitor I42 family protein [Acidimicrobiia bacterium]
MSALVVIVFIVAGCGGGTVRALSEADSGSEVEVPVGAVLEVTLEENPSTGYRWETMSLPDMIELVADEYLEPDTDLVGAPGTRVLRFEAVTENAGILRLEYVRSFEEAPVPERVVEYVVIVGNAVWPPEPTDSTPGTSTATAPGS